ncbi:unnamed protein product [Spirodela intermedia]|uniref:Uncharacterized protein n=1 Tax=Spirodela intermedia TaxID=51605 RepID=A0A7I8L7X0_SPIIN|nr:unnamed protein product [Spirodela intermedia]
MEPHAVSHDDLSVKLPADDLRHLVAVNADPQVLHHPYRHRWRRLHHPVGDGQPLAVLAQRHLLLLLPHIVQHRRRRRAVPRQPHPLRHLLQHRPDPLHLRVRFSATSPGGELVEAAGDLHAAQPRRRPYAAVPHRLPQSGHLLPLRAHGVQIGEDHVVLRISRLQLQQLPGDGLALCQHAPVLAADEEGPPDHRIWRDGHGVDEGVSLLDQPGSAEEVNHAAVVLHVRLDP